MISVSGHQKLKRLLTNHQVPAVLKGYIAEVLMEMAVLKIRNSP